jgi:hypothetical protein
MPDASDDELDYLLSRGMLSGPKRAELLDHAIASARAAEPAPRKAPRWLGARGVGAGLAVAASAALIVVVLRPPHQVTQFRAKGSGAGAPILDVTCVGATLKACPRGSLLAFSVRNPGGEATAAAGSFVSAYSDPSSGGQRIWYLTNEPVVGSVVPKVARIGDEHRPGSYRAQVVLSRRPLSRAEIVARTAEATAKATAEATAGPPDLTAHADLELVVLP